MGETESGIVCGLPSEDSGSSCRQRVAKERTRLASVHNDDIRGVPLGLIEHLVILPNQNIKDTNSNDTSESISESGRRGRLRISCGEPEKRSGSRPDNCLWPQARDSSHDERGSGWPMMVHADDAMMLWAEPPRLPRPSVMPMFEWTFPDPIGASLPPQ